MSNRAKIALYFLLLSATLGAAVSENDFETQILQIRQLVTRGDYVSAGLKTNSLRRQISNLSEIARNHSLIRKAIQQTGASNSTVLTSLQNAQDSFRKSDRAGAVHAFDIADFLLINIDSNRDPAARYASAIRIIAMEATSQKDANPLYLHYAAKAAYEVGRYSEAIAFAQRELKSHAAMGGYLGRSMHLAHTLIGRSYQRMGDDARALNELEASTKVNLDSTFSMGPSMALASEALPRHKDAVLAYLDVCSKIKSWSASSQALVWKQQIESGKTPDFGPLASAQ